MSKELKKNLSEFFASLEKLLAYKEELNDLLGGKPKYFINEDEIKTYKDNLLPLVEKKDYTKKEEMFIKKFEKGVLVIRDVRRVIDIFIKGLDIYTNLINDKRFDSAVIAPFKQLLKFGWESIENYIMTMKPINDQEPEPTEFKVKMLYLYIFLEESEEYIGDLEGIYSRYKEKAEIIKRVEEKIKNDEKIQKLQEKRDRLEKKRNKMIEKEFKKRTGVDIEDLIQNDIN